MISRRRELTILSQVYEIARKEWGIFVHNPVREVKLPPNNRPRDRRLVSSHEPAEDEESRLLVACRACRNPFLLAVVRLALETAMRQGGLITLRWQFIDIKHRTAYSPEAKNGVTSHCRCKRGEKLSAVQMIDVDIPTTDGRELTLTRYTQNELELRPLLEKLKLILPPQPPP